MKRDATIIQTKDRGKYYIGLVFSSPSKNFSACNIDILLIYHDFCVVVDGKNIQQPIDCQAKAGKRMVRKSSVRNGLKKMMEAPSRSDSYEELMAASALR